MSERDAIHRGCRGRVVRYPFRRELVGATGRTTEVVTSAEAGSDRAFLVALDGGERRWFRADEIVPIAEDRR